MTDRAHDLSVAFGHDKPLLGVVHLAPLPGSPGFGGDLARVCDAALRDAEALAAGGASGIVVENFGDAPFFPTRVPPVTIAAMTKLAADIAAAVDLPLGINVLRNDAAAALSIAAVVRARFVRVNVHVGAMLTDQGLIEGDAANTLRLRRTLDACVAIYADVAVKHAAPLAPRSIEDETKEAVGRGLADGIIVTGAATGAPVDVDRLRAAKSAAGTAPVWIGSGTTAENAKELLAIADGLIVGTTLKRGGALAEPVDPERVRRLVDVIAPLR